MAVTTTSRLALTQWSAGTDPFTRAQMNASLLAIEQNAAMFVQGTLAARPAFGKQGRFYFVTDAAAGAPTVFYDTGTAWAEVRPDLSSYATSASVTSSLATKADKTTQVIAGTGLTGGGDLSANRTLTVSYGTTAGTAAQGNDARLSDARPPTGAAGGSLTGTYPNPTIGSGQVTFAMLAAAAVAASGTSSATALVRADDLRLSNARTPTAHTHVLSDLPEAWVKQSVKAASTANVTINPGGTTFSLDGITLANNDRVLLKNQTTTSQNGIYVVGGVGSSVTLTRAAGSNTSSEIAGGTVSIDQGTQGGRLYSTTFKSTDTLGTTAMLWYRVTDEQIMAPDGGTTAGTWVQANDSRLSNARTPTGSAGGSLTGTYPNPTIASGAVTFAMLASAAVAASGTSSATALVRADDSRLSNARTPTGAAGGSLTGTYPSPTIATGAVTDAMVAAANKDGVAGTASLRTLGTGAQQAAAGNHLHDDRYYTEAEADARYAAIGRSIVAGAGLTGGGTLAADRTLDVGAGTGISVAADSISVVYGTTAGTAAQGNDTRLSDARTPTGAAGGHLSGTYPNPTIATGAVTSAMIADGTITDTDVAAANKDGAVGTASLRTLGTGAQQAAAGNHTHTALAGVFQTQNTVGSFAGQWTKVATTTLTGQFADATLAVLLVGGGNGEGYTTYAKVIARVKQQNPLGSAPFYSLYIDGPVYLAPSDVRLVISTNSGTQTIGELWVRVPVSYEVITGYEMSNGGTGWSYLSNQAYQSSAPTGLMFTAASGVDVLSASALTALSTATVDVPQSLFDLMGAM